MQKTSFKSHIILQNCNAKSHPYLVSIFLNSKITVEKTLAQPTMLLAFCAESLHFISVFILPCVYFAEDEDFGVLLEALQGAMYV